MDAHERDEVAPTGEVTRSGEVGDGHLRVSDAERQQIVDVLRTHTGEGRLQLDEFEERTAAAFAARTRADLRGLLHDLPPVPTGGSGGRGPGPRADRRGAVTAGRTTTPAWSPIDPDPARVALRSDPAGGGPPADGAAHHGPQLDRSRRQGPRGHGHRHGHHGPGRHGPGGGFLFVVLLMVGIWAMSGFGYFWPMWVIVPCGLSVVCGRRAGHRYHPARIPTTRA